MTNANIKCSNGDIVNAVIIDKIKYELNDDNTAQVTGYIGTPYSLTIPESISYEGDTFKVTSIGEGAFAHCTSLSNITIPNSVTRIENYAFYGCKNLSDIYYIFVWAIALPQTFVYCIFVWTTMLSQIFVYWIFVGATIGRLL